MVTFRFVIDELLVGARCCCAPWSSAAVLGHVVFNANVKEGLRFGQPNM